MGTAERIKSLCLRGGLSDGDLAAALGLTAQGVRDLERDDAEVETTLSITQALRLVKLLSTDILQLLGENDRPAPLPIARVRAALAAEFKRAPDSREAIEDEIDWDLGPLLEGLKEWESVYTITFIKRLSTAMSLDWRAVLVGLDPRDTV